MKRIPSARRLGLAGILIIVSGCSATQAAPPPPTKAAAPLPTMTARPPGPTTTGAPRPTTTATPPGPRPLDLVADRGFDRNGIPLNPRWGYQASPQISDPRRLCPGGLLSIRPTVRPLVLNPWCTSQSPSWDGPDGFSHALCLTYAAPFEGHSNWSPATYTGTLSNFVKSDPGADDDYSMDLSTPDLRGAFQADGGSVHLEFDSDETIDHFHNAWWSDFHQAADRSNDDAEAVIGGRQAIVTGLMGIDWAHSPGAELHPVWALAIQNTTGWSFFVRNWGNEGYCSSHQQLTDFPAYAFLLPWEYGFGPRGQRIAATDVSILPSDIRSYRVGIPQVVMEKVPGEGVLATFQMPPPPLPGERDGPFYEGQINLQWQFPPGTNPPPHPPPPPTGPRCNKVPPPPTCEENSPERDVGDLLASLSDSQKASMATALRKLDPAFSTSPLSKDAIHIGELSHLPSPPASRPTIHAIVDEQHNQQQKLQLEMLCADFRGTIPHYPKACFHVPPNPRSASG